MTNTKQQATAEAAIEAGGGFSAFSIYGAGATGGTTVLRGLKHIFNALNPPVEKLVKTFGMKAPHLARAFDAASDVLFVNALVAGGLGLAFAPVAAGVTFGALAAGSIWCHAQSRRIDKVLESRVS